MYLVSFITVVIANVLCCPFMINQLYTFYIDFLLRDESFAHRIPLLIPWPFSSHITSLRSSFYNLKHCNWISIYLIIFYQLKPILAKLCKNWIGG